MWDVKLRTGERDLGAVGSDVSTAGASSAASGSASSKSGTDWLKLKEEEDASSFRART